MSSTTTYTLADLGTRVLKDLGLVGAEETPSGADTVWAQETCTTEIAMLSALGLPIWNGSDAVIPAEYFTPLSRRIGMAVAPSFGLVDPASALIAMREAERYLTVMANPRGGNPQAMRADDAKTTRAGRFDFTSGV